MSESKELCCMMAEIIDKLPVGTTCCRRDGTLCQANREMQRMTGYDSFEELSAALGSCGRNVIFEEDHNRVFGEANAVMGKGEGFYSTHRICRKDGGFIWVRNVSRTITSPDGDACVVSCFTDIDPIIDNSAVRQLEQLNSQLTYLNSTIPVGYHRCADTPEYDFLYISSRFCDMLGYTRQEIKELFDDKFARMIHPDDLHRLFDGEDNHASARKSFVRYEYRIRCRSGYMWVVDHSAYLEDRDPPFFQGVIMDITDKVTLQEQLSASNKAFRIAAKEAGNLVFTFSRSRQEIYCDDNTAEIFGINEVQPGVPYGIVERGGIISDDTAGDYVRIHEEIMSGAKEAGGIVKLINHPEGEQVYEVKFHTIPDEYDQPTDLAVGVYKDITASFNKEREQEESLRNLREEYISVKEEMEKGERERMAMIYALSTDYYSLWLLDLDNDILSLRRKDNVFLQESAMPPSCYSEGLVRYADNRVHPSDRRKLVSEASLDNIRERLKTERSFSVRLRRKTSAEENYKYVEWRIVKLDNDGDGAQNAAIIAVKDVDGDVLAEEKQQALLKSALSQAEHANRAKTTFLSNMSHDIRTPMNAIIGFAGIAASHLDNRDRVQDCLEKILSSSRHLLSLINDILDMSRIESGKMTLQEKECDLSERIHSIVHMIRPQMKAKQLEFFVETIDVEDEELIFDPLKLEQVLINILGNAVKFTPPGGIVTFVIRQSRSEKSGFCHCDFIIRDTGIGMSEEFLKHIYEPFERESTATVSGTSGTGLGMSITKNTVDLMGGTIGIESVPGKGSEFTIGLDFRRQDTAARQEQLTKLQGLRGLVVDDDFNICDSVTKMLEQIGMRSDWTTSGREAVFRAQKAHADGDPFYCYIIDWLMPDMNGIETARQIRRVTGDDVPIIILTAYDWTDIEDEAREAGVTEFCSKPLFMSDLRSVLQEAEGKSARKLQPEKRFDFSGRRVLVAEDNELNREIAAEILHSLGFVVETARDGSIAADMVSMSPEGHYDLVLMDIQMPVMDGYEATRAIRSLPRRDVVRMPIVAMTANAFEEDKERALRNGMNAHIAKPLDVDALPAVLDNILNGREETM
ncbi:MAG: response regulator [Oscillospiraceae bacterium]